jgi:N-acetylglutamate synthase-like GNAT family acetyltransferase
MHIRKFKESDSFELSILSGRAMKERNNEGYTDQQINSIVSYYDFDRFLNNSHNKKVYVCVFDGKIVGTGTLKFNEIMACFILPEYQKKGIGKALASFLEDEAKRDGFSKVWLVSALSAQGFYKKLGYSFVSEKLHPEWGKGIVMEKTLL